MSEKLKHLKFMEKKENDSIIQYEIDMLGRSKENFSDIEDPTIDFNLKAEKAFSVAVAGMDKPAIVDLNTAISADIQVRVTAPDYNPKYLPLPTTYLNGELWKDEHFVVVGDQRSTVERWTDLSWADDIEL